MRHENPADSEMEAPRGRFRFVDHPWLSLATFVFLHVLLLGVAGALLVQFGGLATDSWVTGFLTALAAHGILLFVITPYLLRLPRGRRSFPRYLEDIGLSRLRPTGPLVALALSCYAILALSQIAGSVVHRLTEGLPITGDFLPDVLDVTHDLPPRSPGLLTSVPSAFEEIAFRGVLLTLFLTAYSRRRAIFITAAAFGAIHLLNLLGGRELVWVLGQVGWAFCMGLFYGEVFVRTKSLLPPMLVHYLGNVFIGSFTGYIAATAPVEVEVFYGLTFSLGVVPVSLMILWTRFFTGRWLPRGASPLPDSDHG